MDIAKLVSKRDNYLKQLEALIRSTNVRSYDTVPLVIREQNTRCMQTLEREIQLLNEQIQNEQIQNDNNIHN